MINRPCISILSPNQTESFDCSQSNFKSETFSFGKLRHFDDLSMHFFVAGVTLSTLREKLCETETGVAGKGSLDGEMWFVLEFSLIGAAKIVSGFTGAKSMPVPFPTHLCGSDFSSSEVRSGCPRTFGAIFWTAALVAPAELGGS